MDSVISGLQAKLQTLKSSNVNDDEEPHEDKPRLEQGRLDKFIPDDKNEVMDIKVVDGKEEFSIRFDKEVALDDAKNISCSSNGDGGDEIAQRIKGKLT